MKTQASLAPLLVALVLSVPASAQEPDKPAEPAPAASAVAPAAPATPAASSGPSCPCGHDKARHDEAGHDAHGGGTWSKVTLSPGLQMWRAAAATEAGDILEQNVVGLVLKAQMTVNDMVALHFRGAYGMNKIDTPNVTRDASAWMVGLGLDMYMALGRRVIWYNTMGLGYQQSKLTEDGKDHPVMHNPGAYFITTLDISMSDSIGMWMDWGCGVVGPAFADTMGGDAKVWDINPLGAGGFRFSF